MIYWLLEVVYPEAGRSPKYFNGEVQPGWHGGTTMDPNKAVRYDNEYLAHKDRRKLAPRELGQWQAVQHIFTSSGFLI